MAALLRPMSLAAVLALLPALAAAVASADDKDKASQKRPASYEPAAMQLLNDVARAYKSLSSYADEGMINVAIERTDNKGKAETKRSIAFTRPNKLALDYGDARMVSDGKDARYFLEMPKKYVDGPAPAGITQRAIAQARVLGNLNIKFVGNPGDMPVMVMLDLLGSTQAVDDVLEGTDGLKLEADRKRDGKTSKSLLVDQSQGPDIRLLIDPESKLVQSVEMVYNLDELNAHAPENARIKSLSYVWNAGKIRRDVPASTFALEPPKNFTELTEKDLGGGDKSAVEELVGKPAPDFTLTALDADGKTRKVTKDELAGKVVMIDFWATWCPPCLRELPEVQKMVDAYARDKKDVFIVALSEDSDPAEPAELRKLVEKTLKDKEVTLARGPRSLVALDPENAIGEKFRIEALPTIVLLDAKGIVRVAHVGYTETAELTGEIDALLAGKELPHEKQADKDKDKDNK